MITTRGKWIAAVVSLLLLAGYAIAVDAVRMYTAEYRDAYTIPLDDDRLKGNALSEVTVGGVAVAMSDDAVKLFLESYFNSPIGAYVSFGTSEDAVEALRNGRIDALWAPDAAAAGICSACDTPLAVIEPGETPGDSERNGRFSFAFAFRPEDTELRDSANAFLAKAMSEESNYAREQRLLTGDFRQWPVACGFGSGNLYIGITGEIPGLEKIGDGTVSGGAVELAGDFAGSLGRKPVFTVLPAGTAYNSLLAGKIDMLAVSATSENHSLTTPKYITSVGYLNVLKYNLLIREKRTKPMGIMTSIKENLIAGGAYRQIASAAFVTVAVTLLSWVAAAVFGYIFHALRGSRRKALRGIGTGAAYIFRRIPALLLVLLFGAGIFGGTHLPLVLPAALGVGLFGAGLLAEEAGSGSGLSEWWRFLRAGRARRIAVTLLQWTTVVNCLGIRDFAGVMQSIGNRTMIPAFSVVFAIAFYLVATVILERIPCAGEKTAASAAGDAEFCEEGVSIQLNSLERGNNDEI